jgi:hypothetical protein
MPVATAATNSPAGPVTTNTTPAKTASVAAESLT